MVRNPHELRLRRSDNAFTHTSWLKTKVQNTGHGLPVSSVQVLGNTVRWTWVSRYRNVSLLDFIGAKDDEGGEW